MLELFIIIYFGVGKRQLGWHFLGDEGERGAFWLLPVCAVQATSLICRAIQSTHRSWVTGSLELRISDRRIISGICCCFFESVAGLLLVDSVESAAVARVNPAVPRTLHALNAAACTLLCDLLIIVL